MAFTSQGCFARETNLWRKIVLAEFRQRVLIETSQQDFQRIININTPQIIMAKAMSKSQVAAAIAEENEISKKQAAQILDSIAELAYKQAKNTFTLPGLGKLVLVNRAARMGRNPATGEAIKIPAKRVVKFRVAKAAKDAILGAR
jgi:DNA-binding protein HU-beta